MRIGCLVGIYILGLVEQEIVRSCSWDGGSLEPGSEVAEDHKQGHLLFLLLLRPVEAG